MTEFASFGGGLLTSGPAVSYILKTMINAHIKVDIRVALYLIVCLFFACVSS